MRRYDPDKAPDPEMWLSLDERERIQLAEDFHKTADGKLRNIKVHAAFRAIVENQLAEGLVPVARAMTRLEAQGLSRHDCTHAVGWILSQHFYEVMDANEPGSPEAAQSRYIAAGERLDAATWRALGES